MQGVTVDQALATAVGHHQRGRLQEAEAIYRQILSVAPEHPGALHMLGVLALQAGRADLAAEWIGKAAGLRPRDPAIRTNLAAAQMKLGRLEEAERSCLAALEADGNFAAARTNLGLALSRQGRHADAVSVFREAVQRDPASAEGWSHLGSALTAMKAFAEAAEACGRALSLRPGDTTAQRNLGAALSGAGDLDGAERALRAALAADPGHPDTAHNLGCVLDRLGREAEAEEVLTAALASGEARGAAPEAAAETCLVLAGVRRKRGDAAGAAGMVECAEAMAAGHADIAVAAASEWSLLGRPASALTSAGRATALRPGHVEARYQSAAALYALQQPEEALAVLEGLSADGAVAAGVTMLHGDVLRELCRTDEALTRYRVAEGASSDGAEAGSRAIVAHNYQPGTTAASQFEMARAWAERYAGPLLNAGDAPHANPPEPDRRLKIGYVSDDFHAHASAYFLVPLLEHHDRSAVEVVCYHCGPRWDAYTERMARAAGGLRRVHALDDAALAATVRNDGIDVLVDLKLHTPGNRLKVFARQPAPVQVTWLGYPGTTGLTTIGHRISDPFLDPPDRDTGVYTEATHRLAHTFWCYDPFDAREVEVSPPPAARTGRVTFGCLNGWPKLNAGTLGLWAAVMREVAGSALVVMAGPSSVRAWVTRVLEAEGVDASRVEFVGRQGRTAYLATYGRIDLCLDTFPYNGHTTGLDSLWMGVPVVTLAGDPAVSRAGLSQLSNLGLADLAAATPDEFIRTAVGLATDPGRLAHLRSTIRQRMLASPLMDAAAFARELESAYRTMWRGWCTGR